MGQDRCQLMLSELKQYNVNRGNTMTKTKLLACAVVVEELRARLPAEIECETLDFGLHRSPELLRAKLQETIDKSTGCSTIALAFGLCGMAVVGLRSESATLVVPRAR